MSFYKTIPVMRTGKPQTAKQKQAARENYILFQIQGAIRNLTALNTYYNVPGELTPDHHEAFNLIFMSCELLNAAKYSIKLAQVKRKEISK